VFPRSELEGGWLYQGAPARPLRRLAAGELDRLHAVSRAEADAATGASGAPAVIEAEGHLFVAATARLAGRIVAGQEVGIWYGCILDAGAHHIQIGASSNIQDNSVIRCAEAPVRIGREVTIGHNVALGDCTIADRSLVGMGAVVAPGTVIEEDVMLAAGGRTVPGQRLEGGWLYGGNPARQLAPLGEARRAIITRTWPTYRDYARTFARAQAEIAGDPR
jgi:carbonic anhydrase/acetyltransferase-like protein (isoleucine patch superfamily)